MVTRHGKKGSVGKTYEPAYPDNSYPGSELPLLAPSCCLDFRRSLDPSRLVAVTKHWDRKS
jgi:hypothetical protein